MQQWALSFHLKVVSTWQWKLPYKGVNIFWQKGEKKGVNINFTVEYEGESET